MGVKKGRCKGERTQVTKRRTICSKCGNLMSIQEKLDNNGICYMCQLNQEKIEKNSLTHRS